MPRKKLSAAAKVAKRKQRYKKEKLSRTLSTAKVATAAKVAKRKQCLQKEKLSRTLSTANYSELTPKCSDISENVKQEPTTFSFSESERPKVPSIDTLIKQEDMTIYDQTEAAGASWQGPAQQLDQVLRTGSSYDIKGYVKLLEPNGRGAEIFYVTLRHNLEDGSVRYQRLADNMNANYKDGWIAIEGHFSLPNYGQRVISQSLYVEGPGGGSFRWTDSV